MIRTVWAFTLIGLLLTIVGLVTTAADDPPPPSTIYRIHVQVQGQGTIQVNPASMMGKDSFSSGADTYIFYSQACSLIWQATEDQGWSFDHWELGASGSTTTSTDNPATITLGSSSSEWRVHAVFVQAPPTQYTLTMAVAGNGTTAPSVGTYTYDEGTPVPLTATPDAGWQFDHWDGDVANPNALATSITMNGNKSVTAHFVEIPPTEYTLTMQIADQGQGTTTPSVGPHTYPAGTSVTVSATPSNGWDFLHWDDDLSGTQNPKTITMDSDKTVTAVFTQEPVYVLTMAVEPAGAGTTQPSVGSSSYQTGTVVQVSAWENEGYEFDHWEGALTGSSASGSVTMNSNKSITAHFASIPSPPPHATDMIDDDVESGPGAWDASPLWHVTDNRSHSPSHSWWFGDERTGTYASTAATAQDVKQRTSEVVKPMAATGRVFGALTSEPISLSNYGRKAEVAFSYWREVESYNEGAFDKTMVQVKFGGGWETIWQLDSRTASEKQWNEVMIAVEVPPESTEMQIEMQIRFVFDSVDGLKNDYAGWFVDDIHVAPAGHNVVVVVPPLPHGTVGEEYEVQLGVYGGVEPYAWSWSGDVPGGLELEHLGMITGIPETRGDYQVTITATDAAGDIGTATCSIHIDDPGSSCILLAEDFTAQTGWTMTSLWHIASGLSCLPYASLMGDYAYFGKSSGCSYATGATVTGALSSPPVDIEGVTNVVIEFDQYRHVEAHLQAYDKTWLEVSFDGSNWQPIWQRVASDTSPEGCHVQVANLVPSGAQHMWIRFRFDSVDRFYNDYPGWAIDNVQILNAACVGSVASSQTALPSALLTPARRDQVSISNWPNPVTDVHTTTFTVRGQNVEAMKIQIFNLNGELLYEEQVAGNELEWHTDNNWGEYLPNGVYQYRALVKVGGEWITTDIRSVVIVR